MSAEQNKAVVRHFFEKVDQGKPEAAVELLAANAVIHFPGNPGPMDREGFKQVGVMFRAAFPDGYHTVEHLIAEEDKVVARYTFRGTHKGELMGIPPTGKQATVTGIAINRITNDKIVERWDEFDQLGLMQQLGVIPVPEETAA
jgi:steroid delta-isomerase-like uncharacterized protein